MVWRYLYKFIRNRYLLRTHLAAGDRVLNNMDRVIVRCVDGDEFMTISFVHSDKHNNLLRPKNESIEKCLERIKASVRKCEKKSNRKNKKAKTDYQQKGEMTSADDDIKCVLFEGQGGNEVERTRVNGNAWAEGSTLKIRDRVYHVYQNMPTVLSLKLPNRLMVGCPIYPRIAVEFAQYEKCSYVWYQCRMGNAAQLSLSKQSSAKEEADLKQPKQGNTSNNNETEAAVESIPMETDQNATCMTSISKIKAIERMWDEVSRDPVFTPTNTMIGCKLKLLFTPKDGNRQGDAKEVVSACQVTQSPGDFPFEKRHLLTKEKMTQDDCFRVVCYNILADMYADSDFSRDVLYPYCPPEALDIDYREQIILKELAGYNGDIVCLQEVGKKFFHQSLQPSLLCSGLNGLLQCKDKQVPEGEAAFYRIDKFRLVEEQNIILCNEVKKSFNSDLLEGIGRSPAMLKRFQDQATIAQVVILEHIAEPSRMLCIANTHLYFHPRAAHIRLVQAAVILRHLETLQKSYKEEGKGDLTLMVCGDLNSNPSSGVYQYVSSGSIPHNSVDWYTSGKEEFCGGIPLRHTLDLNDACKNVEYTNFVAGFHGKLDHVFIESNKLTLERMIPVSTHEEVTKFVALPNEVFPSDHMALVCDIRWL